MTIVAEILLIAAAVLFALSLAGIALRLLDERVLLAIAALFGIGAVAALLGLAVSLIRADGEWRLYIVASSTLAALAAGEVGLGALQRLRLRDRRFTASLEGAYEHIDRRLASHADQRAAELNQTLASERARSRHLLMEQERELAEERRKALTVAGEQAADELMRGGAAVHDQLIDRVRGWSEDLTREQERIAARLESEAREQTSILDAQRSAVDEHSRALHGLGRNQEQMIEEARVEFAGLMGKLTEKMRNEIDDQAHYHRREVAQLAERLKAVSATLREDAYREELDARTRLATDIEEAERRVVASFDRSLERAADRAVETAERRFDEQIRESREETGARLAAELERTRTAYARQIEEQVEARMEEVAKQTTQRLQRQLDQVVRQAEAQTSTNEDRITFITQRLEATLENAAGRVAAFETELELELTTKLTEFERAVRHAEQSVERKTG